MAAVYLTCGLPDGRCKGMVKAAEPVTIEVE
jgi:hypothetical protein